MPLFCFCQGLRFESCLKKELAKVTERCSIRDKGCVQMNIWDTKDGLLNRVEREWLGGLENRSGPIWGCGYKAETDKEPEHESRCKHTYMHIYLEKTSRAEAY